MGPLRPVWGWGVRFVGVQSFYASCYRAGRPLERSPRCEQAVGELLSSFRRYFRIPSSYRGGNFMFELKAHVRLGAPLSCDFLGEKP